MYHRLYSSEILRSVHTLSLCLLYGSQNKQRLIFLHSVKLLVFITETECVYCAVRADLVQLRLILAFKRRCFGFNLRSVHVRFCGKQSDTGTGFSASTQGFLLSIHECSIPIFIYMLLLTDARGGGGNREHLNETNNVRIT